MKHGIWIPDWRPPSLNQLLGCPLRERLRLKKQCKLFIWAYWKKSQIPDATGKRRVSLKINLNGRQKECDPDALWKVLLDSLVQCGALVDDRAEFCELGSVEYHREPPPGTLIVLEDL